MSSKTQRAIRQKSVKNSKLIHQNFEKNIPQHEVGKQVTSKVPSVSQNADGKQDTLKVPSAPQNAEKKRETSKVPQNADGKQDTFKVPSAPQNAERKRETFVFKVPAIPQCVPRNEIPTGKQLPRTPVKHITKPPEEGPVHPELCYVPSSKRNDCLIVDAKVKNFIPKGNEIPRTPTPCYKFLSLSSTRDSQLVLPPDDVDEVALKLQESILSGKVNVRRNTLKTKTKVEGNISNASTKDDQGTTEISPRSLSLNLKSSGEVLTHQSSSKDFTEEVKTKCVIMERSPLKDLCNSKEGVRRNPTRKARRRVDYNL